MVTVFAVVTVGVGVVTVVCCVTVVGLTVVECPMLSDWLVTVDVCFEPPLDTSRTTITITAITAATPPAIAQPRPLPSSAGGG